MRRRNGVPTGSLPVGKLRNSITKCLVGCLEGGIRGKRIAFSAYRKKVKQKHLLELQAKMKDFEIQHSTHKNPQVLTQLKCIKQEINKIYNEQNEAKIRFSRQKYYETGFHSISWVLLRK